MLARQFDSVWVFLIPLVLFSKDLLEPLCLFFRNRLIHRRGTVAYEELLAAAVTPERPHLPETCSFLAATLLYSNCSHLSLQIGSLLTSVISARSSQTQTLERRTGLTAALVRNNF